MELTQIRLIVTDLPRCFRFYRDVLGLRPQFDDDSGPYAKFELPGGTAAIALHDRADLAGSVPGLADGSADRALVVLRVDDVDARLTELDARGARPLAPPADRWGRLRIAYLRDPEWNLIELQQWLDPAS